MAKSNREKVFWSVSITTLAAFVISMGLGLMGPVQRFELQYHDKLFEWRGPIPIQDSSIVLVAMSDDADSEIPEKYPWPTDVYAKLIENLNEAGAKAILLDVIFSKRDTEHDSIFAKALSDYGNVILAGQIQKIQTSQGVKVVKQFPNEVLLENNPNRTGQVSMLTDVDKAVRYYKFGYVLEGEEYYMLGLEGLREYADISLNEVDPLDDALKKNEFDLGPYSIQKAAKNSFIINYYGPEGIFPSFSLDEVIDDAEYTTVGEAEAFEMNLFDDPDFGLLKQGVFKDKIVIVGSTMPTLGDYHLTPYASGSLPRPGFEIHAHAIQTILEGNYINRLNDWVTVVIMLAFCFLATWVTRIFNTIWGVITTLFLTGGYLYTTYMAFVHFSLIFMITGPMLSLIVAQVSIIGYEYYVELKEKLRIKGMFSSYVSPELVNQMVESGEEPQLGGEKIYMTAFFSDIQSFSTFSEQLDANRLVELINEYLNAMTDILNDQGGTLDKYIGDAIVGFFGAPVSLQDHALKSCIASQLMQKKQAELRQKWKNEDWPDIVGNMQTRIGINTGAMVTGNMGSVRRFNYTMMGDNVNLAARCESGAKQYGVYTMVTESTKKEAESCGDDCVFRLLDNIVVKGRTQPVKVYEIADLKADADEQLFECISLYEDGMRLYFNQEWDKAINKFQQSAKLERHTPNPSEIFIERCRMMKAEPPEAEWNGVFVMKSK
ncbi:MAG: adenylate/guanylate cyclase domain-containing protein [Balneolaceae bacterium]|nr:adenylate/guanylate cyclase domain-containing protein [Balneolaceae bacterium]